LAATLPFERLIRLIGWRMGLLAAGIACSLAFLGAFLLFRRTGQLSHRGGTSSWRTVGLVLRNRASWPMLVIGFGNFAVYFLIQATIGKKFLTDYAGLSSAGAASFTGIMMFVMMSGALAGGFLSRLLGNRRKPLVLAGIGCVLASVLLILIFLHFNAEGKWFLVCYILLACSSVSSAALSALMKEHNAPDAVGTSIGLSNGMAYIAVAVVSSMAGVIMDRYQGQTIRTATAVIYPKAAYQDIFLFCVALSAGALLVACFIRETHGRHRIDEPATADGTLAGNG
jgi:predicted MFS family arabinose efflux permease